jgi:hypothetical protein
MVICGTCSEPVEPGAPGIVSRQRHIEVASHDGRDWAPSGPKHAFHAECAPLSEEWREVT